MVFWSSLLALPSSCHDLLNKLIRQMGTAADIQILEIVAFHVVLLPAPLIFTGVTTPAQACHVPPGIR